MSESTHTLRVRLAIANYPESAGQILIGKMGVGKTIGLAYEDEALSSVMDPHKKLKKLCAQIQNATATVAAPSVISPSSSMLHLYSATSTPTASNVGQNTKVGKEKTEQEDTKQNIEMAAQKLQEALTFCIDNRLLCERHLKEFATAPVNIIKRHFYRQSSAFDLNMSEIELRKLCKDYFETMIAIYTRTEAYIHTLSIDEAYISLRIAIFSELAITGNKQNKKGYENENRALKHILSLLKALISKALNNLIEAGYLDFKLNQVGTLWEVLNKSEFIDPINNLCKIYNSSFCDTQHPDSCLLGAERGLIITQDIERFKIIHKQVGLILDEFIIKTEKTEKILFEKLIPLVITFKELYIEIRKIMRPIRIYYKQLEQEVTCRLADYPAWLQLETLIQEMKDKSLKSSEEVLSTYLDALPKELTDRDAHLFPNIKELSTEIQHKATRRLHRFASSPKESRKIRLFEQLRSEREKLKEARLTFEKTNKQSVLDDDQFYHLSYLAFKTKELLERYKAALPDYYKSLHAQTEIWRQIGEEYRSKKTTATAVKQNTTQNTKLSKDKKQKAAEAASVAARKTPVKKSFSYKEWVNQRNQESTANRARKIQALIASGKVAITLKNKATIKAKMAELYQTELKLRQDRVQRLRLNDSIKMHFQKLYNYDFSHDDMVNLEKALQVIGENIQVEYHSSHYTIKIGFHITHCDNDETENTTERNDFPQTAAAGAAIGAVASTVVSGKAFKPHAQNLKAQKNSKCFAAYIIENIQWAFMNAGYTPEALNITVSSQKFDPLKLSRF